ncbi:hypothetical protein MCOR07_002958 [Pyricularia oryzae]|uniref:Uncharacterized protein n=1 Tax=Pyricularia grisea TaxID=148305 RepID=A0ABQ8NWQ6_PYRGI|nr:hypothetical protein MCOR19_006949 [Pyricularia oryzae]KAI6303247.1 hypothetical protein MCOR33_001512 [Pyricularia grisea]KAI6310005.1 hypothetical protein MCOR34_006539 [Pyricularia oryzae]KAI6373167.1 hypothetical protein MCOR32_005809 [Pyricularia oryzae]KAI6430372.1 hypothetical protein MCOR24_001902 [Pyricularia oryzae]
MTIANNEDTISHRSRQVQQRFIDIIKYLTAIEDQPSSAKEECNPSPPDVEGVLGKFDMWAGNLGALRAPGTKLSLDQRLAVDLEIRGQICVDLDELLETLDELTCILQTGDVNKPENDFSESFHHEAEGSASDEEMIDDDICKASGPQEQTGRRQCPRSGSCTHFTPVK